MHRCSCGLFHHHQTSSLSMLFSMPYDQHMCPYTSSSSSSSVDCTLSLGTPATRLTAADDYDLPEQRRASRFCWDFLQSDELNHSPAPASHKGHRGGAVNSSGVDPLMARRCANCDTTSTPLWRNGPRGPKSLCNACGIRFKKEERRANAAAATAVSGGVETPDGYNQNVMTGNPWVHHTQTTSHKMPASCYSPAAAVNEFRFRDDVDDRDSTFLSWRLNVTDRPGLVHDFTRF